MLPYKHYCIFDWIIIFDVSLVATAAMFKALPAAVFILTIGCPSDEDSAFAWGHDLLSDYFSFERRSIGIGVKINYFFCSVFSFPCVIILPCLVLAESIDFFNILRGKVRFAIADISDCATKRIKKLAHEGAIT